MTMEYADIQTIALAILTSIITGGFVLVFIEIGNRKNRENDRYDRVMSPFMHRLSSYFRFMSWSHSYIEYPKQLNDNEKEFKKLVDRMANYGGRAIVSGGDYGIDFFSAEELSKIAYGINNIWYYHDKMNPCNLKWSSSIRGTEEFITKEIKEINSIYLSATRNVELVAKISGEFFTDYYQHIEFDTFRHEDSLKQYGRQSVIVSIFFAFVLLVLGLMLFVRMPVLLLQVLGVISILMVLVCIPLLAVDVRVQIEWWDRVSILFKKKNSKRKA